MDLCTLVGNVLDNAIEAEEQAAEPEGILFSMRMSREGHHIIIQVENSYSEKNSENQGKYNPFGYILPKEAK